MAPSSSSSSYTPLLIAARLVPPFRSTFSIVADAGLDVGAFSPTESLAYALPSTCATTDIAVALTAGGAGAAAREDESGLLAPHLVTIVALPPLPPASTLPPARRHRACWRLDRGRPHHPPECRPGGPHHGGRARAARPDSAPLPAANAGPPAVLPAGVHDGGAAPDASGGGRPPAVPGGGGVVVALVRAAGAGRAPGRPPPRPRLWAPRPRPARPDCRPRGWRHAWRAPWWRKSQRWRRTLARRTCFTRRCGLWRRHPGRWRARATSRPTPLPTRCWMPPPPPPRKGGGAGGRRPPRHRGQRPRRAAPTRPAPTAAPPSLSPSPPPSLALSSRSRSPERQRGRPISRLATGCTFASPRPTCWKPRAQSWPSTAPTSCCTSPPPPPPCWRGGRRTRPA